MEKVIYGLMTQPTAVKFIFYIPKDNQRKNYEVREIIEDYAIPDLILSWAEKYNITKVRLIGSQSFTQKFVDRTKEKELLKYNEHKLEFKQGRLG